MFEAHHLSNCLEHILSPRREISGVKEDFLLSGYLVVGDGLCGEETLHLLGLAKRLRSPHGKQQWVSDDSTQ